MFPKINAPNFSELQNCTPGTIEDTLCCLFEDCIQRTMEVRDRAFKESEREDAVRAAAEATLDRAYDSAILSRAGLVDELSVALHRLPELGVLLRPRFVSL